MLKSFLCPFTPNDIVPPDIKEPDYKNIDEICVKITSDEKIQKSITMVEPTSLYDSNDWLNNIDMKIDWKNTVEFVPPVEKGIVIKVYDGDTITIARIYEIKIPNTDKHIRYSCSSKKISNDKTVLIITHEKEIFKICDNIIDINNLKHNRLIYNNYKYN
jgi:hypothetical protein